jgi:hypothetical protein
VIDRGVVHRDGYAGSDEITAVADGVVHVGVSDDRLGPRK